MALLILFGVIAGLFVGYTVASKKHQTNYLALAEYWVYLPGVEQPQQTDVMTRLIQENPYSRRGLSPIGPSEGLVFSDVRLHTALVLRTKNTHIFRQDLFESHTGASPETLAALSSAKSLVKLRFSSEIPLTDRRHLQLLIHAADAIAALGNGLAIYDLKAERFFTPAELSDALRSNFDATVYDLHVNVFWRTDLQGGTVETKGLIKVGLPELKTHQLNADQRVVATSVVEEAVRQLWPGDTIPQEVQVRIYDDTFKVQVDGMKDSTATVRILRVQEA